MLFLYSSLLYLLTPFFLLRLWWKGRRAPGYRERIAERFSLSKTASKGQFDVWVHAVSLGEVIAAVPLIESMLEKKWRVLITTMTPTGANQVKTRFGNQVAHRYMPYDLPFALRRFFKSIQCHTGLIMETELWPNMIKFANKAGIPLFLINARLSERSCRGYRKIRFLIRPVLNQFQGILTQSPEDASRFQALGADPQRLSVPGNIKFDLPANTRDFSFFQALKKHWGEKRVALILASTHDNEEQQILPRLKRLQKAIPDIVILIAPRHPERFQKVAQLSRQLGFRTGLRSAPESLTADVEVVVLDSLGELPAFYQLSDYAFVGGSLVPVGGHNVLEPIAMRVPVFTGREVHNFQAICRDLSDKAAILFISSADELVDAIIRLHENPVSRDKLVKKASAVLKANQGAVLRYLSVIEQVVEKNRLLKYPSGSISN